MGQPHWLNIVFVIPFLQLQKVKCIGRELKEQLQVYKVSPEAVLLTPCQHILLFATVIKGIKPTTFIHVIYNISDFLHFPAELKCTRAAPLYFLFLAGKCKKSQKCYTLYLVKDSHGAKSAPLVMLHDFRCQSVKQIFCGRLQFKFTLII